MGAVIPMNGRPKDVKDEAYVAIAGPILGGLGASLLCFVGLSNGSQLLLSLADIGFMLNLFNLLPLGQLDGGRVSNAISKHLLLLGLGSGTYMALTGVISNPLFYIILISGAFSTYSRYFGGDSQPHPSYFRINNNERILWSLAYFGLIAALIVGMQINREKLKSVKILRKETGQVNRSQYEEKFEKFANDFGEDDPYLMKRSENDVKDEDFFKDYFGERK